MAEQLTPTDILNYHHRILKKREYNRHYYQTRIKPTRGKKKADSSLVSQSPLLSSIPSPQTFSPPNFKAVSPQLITPPSPSPKRFFPPNFKAVSPQLITPVSSPSPPVSPPTPVFLALPPTPVSLDNLLQSENIKLRNQVDHLQSENELLHETIDQLRNKYSELLMQYSHKILPKLGD